MKFKKLPRTEFFKTALLILVPYFFVQVMALSVTEPKPSFWIGNAVILAFLIISLFCLYIFGVERKTHQ